MNIFTIKALSMLCSLRVILLVVFPILCKDLRSLSEEIELTAFRILGTLESALYLCQDQRL